MTTKDTPDETEHTGTAIDEGPAPDEHDAENGRISRDIVSYLEWGALLGLGLIALIAVFQFYFASSRAISIWVSPDFEPVFQAAFNIIMLLLATTGIIIFARRRQLSS